MKHLLLILVLIGNFSILIQAQSETDVLVNHLQAGEQNTEGANSLVVNQKNIFVLWSDFSADYHTYLSRSTNGGANFEDGKKIGGDSPHVFGGLAIDAGGILYTVWNGIVEESLSGIHFSKSTDEGMSFSSPVEISSDGLCPQIQIDGSMIYISFFQPKADQRIGLFFCRSVDGGESFDAPKEITDVSLEMRQIKLDTPHSLFVDSQGNIYCTWNDGRREDGSTDIYLARSSDQGVSFGSNIRVNSTDGKIRTGSMVGAFDDYVFAVWRQDEDDNGSGRKIMYSFSANQGGTFSEEKELATGGFGSPNLIITPANQVLITYPHIMMDHQGLYFTILDEDLQDFSDPKLLNSTNSEAKHQSVFVSETDTLFACWTSHQNENDDVYFTRTYIGKPPVIRDFDLIIGDQEEVMIPGYNQWGLNNTPDGAVSYSKNNNEVKMWISAGESTTLLIGPDLDNLTPFPLNEQGMAQYVLEPSRSGFDSCYAGAYSVIPAYNNEELLMIYHAENHPCPGDPTPVRFGIGLARSNDGTTWQKKGQILTTYVDTPASLCEFRVWGVANPTVYYSPDEKYLYMLYWEPLREAPFNRPDGFYLARAPIESDGEPGSWEKYKNGSFSESGFGGLGSLVIYPPNGTPYGFPYNFAGQPSVSFNSFLNLYVMVFQSKVGLHVATSEDGIEWSNPELAWEVPESANTNNDPSVAYFCLISPEQPSQMTTSQTGYLYFARMYPNWDPPTTMSRRSFEIKPKSTSTLETKRGDVRSFRLQNYPNPFNGKTTFSFFLSFSGKISLKVYDQSGREISTILNGFRKAGNQEVIWDAPNLPSGIYFYKITSSSGTSTKKMVIQKPN